MKIIHEWEEDKDGIIFSCKAYEDGHIEKNRKESFENALTNTEQNQLDISMNLQYLVDLAEIKEEV